MKKAIVFLISFAVVAIAATAQAAVTTYFEISRDRNGIATYALGPCSHVDARVLSAGVAESHSVPSGAKYVVFTCVDSSGNAASFYANFSTTAAIPAADVTDGSGSELNPTIRYIGGVSAISLIVPADAIVVMMYYK